MSAIAIETPPQIVAGLSEILPLIQRIQGSPQRAASNIANARIIRSSAHISCISVAATNAGTKETIEARNLVSDPFGSITYSYNSDHVPKGAMPIIATMKKIRKLG
jgi:hypothetical protein